MKLAFAFVTQYHQFYISDSLSQREISGDYFWTPEAYNDRLAMAEGILGIGTECYGPVNGEIEILDAINEKFDMEKFDHIVEAGIDIQSGYLEILECPTSTVQLKLNIYPGSYRARIYSSNLDSVDGGEAGDDYYKIELWLDKNATRKIIKQYHSK